MNEKKKVFAVTIEGWASSFFHFLNQDKKTISHYVAPIMFDALKIDDYIEIHSTRWSSIKTLERFINENSIANPGAVWMFFTKSYGYTKLAKYLKYNSFDHSGIVWVSIDPHGGGVGRKKGIKGCAVFPDHGWEKTTVFNYYQTNKSPRGGKFIGAHLDANLSSLTADHWTIIHNKHVLKGIAQACQMAAVKSGQVK